MARTSAAAADDAIPCAEAADEVDAVDSPLTAKSPARLASASSLSALFADVYKLTADKDEAPGNI